MNAQAPGELSAEPSWGEEGVLKQAGPGPVAAAGSWTDLLPYGPD